MEEFAFVNKPKIRNEEFINIHEDNENIIINKDHT